jgi:hypothetical protein
MSVSLAQARAAKKTVLEQCADLVEVIGVGITRVRDDYAVKVNLARPLKGMKLPTRVDGVPVRIEVTGPIKPR